MNVDPAVSLEDKVRLLASAAAYADAGGPIEAVATHMSWLFFVGNRVLKLKKPVRFPYLDFSTLRSGSRATPTPKRSGTPFARPR